MAAPKTVWGIDIGQCALKTLKLRSLDGQLQVEAFDIIEHPKILSQPDADRRQLVRNALEQFLARNNVVGSTVVVAVPGQSSFTRFVKLPPVDPSQTGKIERIIGYEAEQQIPFPIGDVIWRWQMFRDPEGPDVEVGIFAMKRADVSDILDHFSQVSLNVDVVQMAPLALYNFMKFDEQAATDGATLLADVGADKTDLVVADGPRIWTRTIQIGGNNFTESLVRAFKLSFAKAEKLKRTAATSKYARQIFQAMRPVFADLVQEIQRSIGYYTSLHRETRFKRLLGLGNGFRLPGLQKFLEQNLNIPVVRIDSYNKLSPSPTVSAPTFTENVLSFAVAYGLALQGLDLTAISTNLLPSEIARRRVWGRKKPWWAAAAAMILVGLAGMVYGSYRDLSTLASDTGNQGKFAEANAILQHYEGIKRDYQRWRIQGDDELEQIKGHLRLYGYRNFWPTAQALIFKSIEAVATDQPKLEAYSQARGEDPNSVAIREKVKAAIKAIERKDRRIIVVTKIEASYVPELVGFDPEQRVKLGGNYNPPSQPKPSGQRGFWVEVECRTPLTQQTANVMISEIRAKSVDIANSLGVVGVKGSAPRFLPSLEVSSSLTTRPRISDPMFLPNDPKEDLADDTRFMVGWLLEIKEKENGVNVPEPVIQKGP